MTADAAAASPPAFSRGGVLALVAGGFALLLAVLYLIGAGADFGGEGDRGQGHAAANGLNGFSGLVRLTEAQGYTVTRSRSAAGLRTGGLLVLTPGFAEDPEAFGKVLEERRSIGPTLVIMPKWLASQPPPNLSPEARERFKRGWVVLDSAEASAWPADLPGFYSFALEAFSPPAEAGAKVSPRDGGRWRGMGRTGVLPTPVTFHARTGKGHEPLVTDETGRALAFGIGFAARKQPTTASEVEQDIDMPRIEPVVFLAEPDLANNYGLADPQRAAVAMALIERLTRDGTIDTVTFDMTLAGFGASENLLTLAFRPPFLAATLCLIAALLIVGWRAFRRFGPPAVAGERDIAFGKRQLIVNGASLILRARRFRLLAEPYAALAARRLADRLGLARPDPQAIDAALARRLPDEEPFTRRAARLEAAAKPAAILAAAASLDDLATKLQQGPTKP
ncbi:MAG: DUF4350 domain-containing protein [Erythrobacter sp.]